MGTKICTFQDYELYYEGNSYQRDFYAIQDREVITRAPTQDALEKKLKGMNKQGFKRIPIMEIHRPYYNDSYTIAFGEVTSLNRDDKEVWVSFSGKRSKSGLGYCPYHEKTEANIAIARQIIAKRKEVSRIEMEIDELRKSMEKPINKAYFGIPEKNY